MRDLHNKKEARTANSRFAKAGISCFYDSEVPMSRPEKSLHIKPCKYESKRKKET